MAEVKRMQPLIPIALLLCSIPSVPGTPANCIVGNSTEGQAASTKDKSDKPKKGDPITDGRLSSKGIEKTSKSSDTTDVDTISLKKRHKESTTKHKKSTKTDGTTIHTSTPPPPAH